MPFALTSALIFLLVTAALYGYAFYLGGDNICTSGGEDTVAISVPFCTSIKQQFAKGHFPLWDDHIYCGVPLVIQTSYFYPVLWLLALLPVPTFMNVDLAGHIFLAGFFMSLYARSRGISSLGSIVSGLILSLGAASTLQLFAGHDTVLVSIAWMPMIFLALDKLFEKPRLWWALLGSLFVCFSVLGGLAQLTFYGAILAGIYTAIRLGEELLHDLRLSRAQRQAEPESVVNPYEVDLRIKPDYRRIVSIGLLALIIYPLGALLSSVALFPDVAINQETLRSAGLDLKMAASSSEPPGMFISLFDPTFWGDQFVDGHPAGPLGADKKPLDWSKPAEVDYLNRANFWEVNCFIGASSLVLAIYGAIRGRREHRRLAVVMIVICIAGALGRYLPWLYSPLANYLPYYASFRAPSRFFIPMTMFLAILAGAGLDAIPFKRVPWWFVITAATITIVVFGAHLWLLQDSTTGGHAWSAILAQIPDTDHVDGAGVSPESVKNAAFVAGTGKFAAESLLHAAEWFGAAALLIFVARFWPRAGWLMGALVAAELFGFAWHYHTINDSRMTRLVPPQWREEAAAARLHDPDSRVVNTTWGINDNGLGIANAGMLYDYDNLYGYDPIILRRYAEFLATIQTDVQPQFSTMVENGLNWIPPIYVKPVAIPGNSSQVQLSISRRLGYLRCRKVFILIPGGQGMEQPVVMDIPESTNLPRAMLVQQAQVLTRRDAVLSEIGGVGFDPRQSVILERTPDPAPSPRGEPGSPPIVKQIDADHIDITADVPSPSVLVMTDAYADGWKAYSAPDSLSPQSHYDVMPADYTFRGIPLAAGHHHILLEYSPASYVWGLRVTLATLTAWLVAVILSIRRQRRLEQALEPGEPVVVEVSRVGGAPADEPEPAPLAPRSLTEEPAPETTTSTAPHQPEDSPQKVAIPVESLSDEQDDESEEFASDEEAYSESEVPLAQGVDQTDQEVDRDAMIADALDPDSGADEDERQEQDTHVGAVTNDEGDEALEENDVPELDEIDPAEIEPDEIEPKAHPAASRPVSESARPIAPAVQPPVPPLTPQSQPSAPPVTQPLPPRAPAPPPMPPARATLADSPPPPAPPAMQPPAPPAAGAPRPSVSEPPPPPPAAAKPPATPAAPAGPAKVMPPRPAAIAPPRTPAPADAPRPAQPKPAKPAKPAPGGNWAVIPRFEGFGTADTRRPRPPQQTPPPRKPQPPAPDKPSGGQNPPPKPPTPPNNSAA